jgi:hypothetical protein
MNCCNEFGDCEQGRNCPIRKTKEPDNFVTFERVMDWTFGFLTAIGLLAVCFVIGLWYSGFFHFLAKNLPNNSIIQFLFA